MDLFTHLNGLGIIIIIFFFLRNSRARLRPGPISKTINIFKVSFFKTSNRVLRSGVYIFVSQGAFQSDLEASVIAHCPRDCLINSVNVWLVRPVCHAYQTRKYIKKKKKTEPLC